MHQQHHHHARVTLLRIARVASGLRLDDVARLAGIPATNLSRIECAQQAATRSQVDALARVYGLPPAVLTGHEPMLVSGLPPCISG